MIDAANRVLSLLARGPLLDASAGYDGLAETNLDWPDAEYEVNVRRGSSNGSERQWHVTHKIQGAELLLDAVRDGNVRYFVEAACSRTIWTHRYSSNGATTTVTVPSRFAFGDVHLYPRLIATNDFLLDGNASELSGLWSDEIIAIPKGRVLAVSRPLAVRADGRGSRSPYVIVQNSNVARGEIRGPQMTYRDGDYVFELHVSPQNYDDLRAPWTETLLLGAVFACLGDGDEDSLGAATRGLEWRIERDNEGASIRVPQSRIGEGVARELDAAGIKLWDDGTEWDPMRAASHFVSWEAPPRNAEEEEE